MTNPEVAGDRAQAHSAAGDTVAGDVVAVTMFSLLPGVDANEFLRFSTDLDQPTCRAFGDVVRSFEVYRVDVAPDGAPADVLEVMHVADWAAWEQIRDHHPAFRPVMHEFTRLVDLTSIRTWFAQPVRR
ncbi:MAG: hypothetical protein K0R68_3065 [Mycobacterium sp.]|jgi:hypothetical protein|nr:hypothetical protein [Mycobacterium sp.]